MQVSYSSNKIPHVWHHMKVDIVVCIIMYVKLALRHLYTRTGTEQYRSRYIEMRRQAYCVESPIKTL